MRSIMHASVSLSVDPCLQCGRGEGSGLPVPDEVTLEETSKSTMAPICTITSCFVVLLSCRTQQRRVSCQYQEMSDVRDVHGVCLYC